MRDEYDFSKGQRGKFYEQDVQLNLPVYLDEEVSNYLRKQAETRGKELNEIVNEMLKNDIDLIKTAK
jgi:hypothetical protein